MAFVKKSVGKKVPPKPGMKRKGPPPKKGSAKKPGGPPWMNRGR